MRKYGVRGRTAGDVARADRALQNHAANRRAQRHARLAHFHLVDRSLRGGERRLGAGGFHAALFEQFLREGAFLLERLSARELAGS